MYFITLARKCGTNLEWGIAFIFVTRSNKNASNTDCIVTHVYGEKIMFGAWVCEW